MSSQPVHAISGLTLRHWTIDRREFVGGSQRPAPARPHSVEHADGSQTDRLASKLTRVKSELARRESQKTLTARLSHPSLESFAALREEAEAVRVA